MSLSLNKSVGGGRGGCFCVPSAPGPPKGSAGPFNVDSRAVCADVGLLESLANTELHQHILFRPI